MKCLGKILKRVSCFVCFIKQTAYISHSGKFQLLPLRKFFDLFAFHCHKLFVIHEGIANEAFVNSAGNKGTNATDRCSADATQYKTALFHFSRKYAGCQRTNQTSLFFFLVASISSIILLFAPSLDVKQQPRSFERNSIRPLLYATITCPLIAMKSVSFKSAITFPKSSFDTSHLFAASTVKSRFPKSFNEPVACGNVPSEI